MIFDQPQPVTQPIRKDGALTLALGANALIGSLIVLFATSLDSIDPVYGWGLFAVLPIFSGFIGTLIYGWNQTVSVKESAKVSALSITVLGFSLVAVHIEGIICLVMAAPIGYPMAMMGGTFASAILDHIRLSKRLGTTMMLAIALPFGTIQWERVFPAEPPLYAVKTTVDIAAPAEKVWEALVNPYRLERPDGDIVFHTGIAYPLGAWIEGTGTNATRYCDFSTGRYVEPIVERKENALLRFQVVKNPPPMQEWNPFAEIHPPHLEGFLVVKQGQFRLTPIPGGTRLEGTTWYQHGLQPAGYWRWWSDAIIHRIHGIVLGHLKELAEQS